MSGDHVYSAMVSHASRRGTVWVDGVEAALICWHPRRSTDGKARQGYARVEFGDGRRRTVKTDRVEVLAVAT